MLLHPAAELVHGGHISEARLRIGDQDALLFPLEQILEPVILSFVEDLAQAPAIQLLLCLLLASDHVLEIRQDHHQHKHTGCHHKRDGEHRTLCIHGVGRSGRHGGLFQDLQHDIAHDRVGDHLVLVQQDPDDLEGSPGVTGADLHRQQVGRFNGRCINRTVERIHPQLMENVVSHHGAVQDLREYRGQIGGGIEIVVDRGGAVPGGQHQRGLTVVIRNIDTVRIDVRRHAAQHRHHQDQRPFFQGIPEKDDGVIGHQ